MNQRWLRRLMAVGLALGVVLAPAASPAAAPGYVLERSWAVGGDNEYAVSIRVGPDGNVYVLTAFVVGDDHPVHVYAKDGTLLTSWSAEAGGVLAGMDIDAAGNVHISQFAPEEGLDGKVLVYSATGAQLRSYKVPGEPSNSNPNDIAVDSFGASFIVDYNDHLVSRFAPDGTFLGSFGTEGAAPSQFTKPVSLDVAPDGTLLVLDEDANQVKQFTPAGNFVRAWGQSGLGAGQLYDPIEVRVGPDGHVYVLDYGHRVQEFTIEGQFVAQYGVDQVWGRAIAFDAAGALYAGSSKSADDAILKFVRGTVTTPPPTPTPVPGTGIPAIRSKSLDARRGKVEVRIACGGQGRCEGTISIKRRSLTVAKGDFAIQSGKTATAKAKLTRKGKALLATKRKVKVAVRLSFGGGSTTSKVTLTR